eukprot:gene631-835_t
MINYNVDSDGIATITWDMPNRAMNVLNEASMTAYAGALETALKDEKVKGIIITSGKDSFIAGADLEMILSLDTSDASKLMEQFSQLQRMFRQQETGGKPIVAAINGVPWWYTYKLGGDFDGRIIQSVDPEGGLTAGLPPSQVLGSIVYPAADVVEPGVIHHTYGDRFTLGEPDGSRSER